MASPGRVKKRTRVTRKPKSSRNPLFEKWLQEWKEDAERKDSKTKFVYAKALKSLQKYPLRLHSGKECKVLQHFGSVLCDQLDKRLQKYLAEGGVLPEDSDLSSEDEETPPPKKASRKSASQKNPSSREREYIPTRRSGAYALLLALHKHSGSLGYLTKTVLQEAAQPYADVSFTQTNVVDGQYYSAWSSMGTLIKKELVEKTGNPAKYKLTENGQILAIRLEQAEAELYGSPATFRSANPGCSSSGPSVVPPPAASPARAVKKTVAKRAVRGAKENEPSTLPSKPQPSPFKAVQSVEDDDIIQLDDDDFDRYPLASSKIGAGSSNAIRQTAVKASLLLEEPSSVPVKKPDPPKDIIRIEEDDYDQYPTSISPLKTNTLPEPEESSSEDEATAEIETASYTNSYDNFSLKPGEYDIFLCVDNAEVAGNRHKDTASKAFQNCGVPVDFRKLAVGDYLWICKPKPGSGISPDKELILPYVVERKRMDDLVQSIKDGRFKEQKFRLINSGLSRPIYLVEEFGNRQNLGLPEASVMQAVANTLMIEKFQVHWTKSSNESVAYLVEVTKQCIAMYQGKTVTSRSYRDDPRTDWQNRLVTFKEYYINSTKQKPVSVTQMFAKHLMQLHGLSVEKSEAIVKSYPTVSALMKAYKAAGSPTSQQQLLSNIEYGKSGKAKRKIGPALSATIAMLYNETRFES